MTASRRIVPLPLVLIGLAALCAALVLSPRVVQAQTPNNSATGAPTISGTVQAGELLSADTSAIQDADGLANVDYSYQWLRSDGNTDTEITGAVGSQYIPSDADIGSTIKVRVDFTDDASNPEQLTGAAMGTVTTAATGSVVWSATLKVGDLGDMGQSLGYLADLNPLIGVTHDGVLTPDSFTRNGVMYTFLRAVTGNTPDEPTNIRVGPNLTRDDMESWTLIFAEDEFRVSDSLRVVRNEVDAVDDYFLHRSGLSWSDGEYVAVALNIGEVVNNPRLNLVLDNVSLGGRFLTVKPHSTNTSDIGYGPEYGYTGSSRSGVETFLPGQTHGTHVYEYRFKILAVRSDGALELRMSLNFGPDDQIPVPDTSLFKLVIDGQEFKLSDATLTQTTGTGVENDLHQVFVWSNSGLTWVDDQQVVIFIQELTPGICGRSPAIQAAIMQRLGGDGNCSDVTPEDMFFIETLHVSQELGTLRARDLADLPDLVSLTIYGTNLHTVESGAFAPVNDTLKYATFTHNDLEPSDLSELTINLEGLSLAHNNITSLGANAFSRFTNLEDLGLWGNPITSLDSDAFDGLSSLRGLYLGGYNPPDASGIGRRQLALSADQFADNRSLNELNLSNSRISTIPADAFNNLNSLRTLVLKNNDLTTLTRDMFHADLRNLRSLSLGCNSLTTDSFKSNWSANVDRLLYLYLHNNDLESVKTSAISSSKFSRLRLLSLENNPNLKTFSTSAFQGHSPTLDILMFGNEWMELRFVGGPPTGWPNNVLVDFHSDVRSCDNYDINVHPPTFRVHSASAKESNDGTDSTMTFSVNLQYSDGETHSVDFHTQEVTATAGSDYTEASGTLTFGPEEYSKAVVVRIKDDNVEDSGETFQVVLSNPTGGAQLHGTAGRATGTILNHEQVAVEATFPESTFSSTRHTGADDSPQVVVAFSEAVAAFGAYTPSVQVTGGTVASVRSHTEDGLENAWMFLITPDGDEDVTFAVVANAACASGGICTADGTPLTVVPPARLIPGPDPADANDAEDNSASDQQNTAATGLPTVSGAPQVGVMLTADVSGINDEDGLTNVSYDYQWIRNDGTSDTDLQDATASTYTPSVSDVGKTIKVRVTFKDDAENAESQTSEATAEVLATVPTEPLSLTVATGDQTQQLDASWQAPSSNGGSAITGYKVQWKEEADSWDKADEVSEATVTGTTHTITGLTGGVEYAVRAVATNDVGDGPASTEAKGTPAGDASEQVVEPENAEPTGLPTIGGTPQVGETLTADTSGIADDDGLDDVSYSYQWVAGDTDIDGAAGSSYVLTSSEQGKTIKVKVSFTDDANNHETLTSAATVAIMPQAGDAEPMAPIWSADMLVVEYTSVSIGAASADLFSNVGGSAGLRIKSLWSYTLDRDLRLAFVEAVPSAADLTLQVGDLSLEFPAGSSGESSFKWTDVDVDWEDGQTIAVSIFLTSAMEEPTPNREAAGAPTISGTPQVGETLTADTSAIADEDGLTNVSYEYQWIAGGSDVDGATGSSYELTSSEQGQTIQVRVTFTDDAENEETLTSAATAAVAAKSNTAPTGLPTITGTAQVEQTLTADTSAIEDEDGLEDVSYSYQWIAGGTDIDGATGSSYTLTASEQGQAIQVRVTFTDDDENEETLTSAATAAVAAKPNTAPTGLPTITGTAQVEQTLTADTAAIDDEDGLENVSYTYQWIAGGTDIDGATGSSYLLTSSEQGQTIQVRVTFTDDDENEETLTSAATAAVAAKPNTAPTGLPTITGTAQVGETLTADTSAIGDEDGLTSISYEYQWTAGGTDIDGATGSSYLLTSSEQGHTIQVRVTFTDDDENEETLTSAATEAVAAKSNTAPTGLPTITGTPQVEQTLTADTSAIDDEDGLTNVAYSYQWIADGTDIDGATGSSYELTSSEQGKTIQVRVTFTDDAENEETLTSEATEAVAAKPNTAPTGLPTITGTPQVEQTLTADTSAIADEDGLTNVSYEYQWIAGSTDIVGATDSSYTLAASELGKTIQVRVTFTDDAENEETLTSEATEAVAAAPVPLTVSVTVSAPATHDGSSEFTFDIKFSEEFGLSYRTLKFHAFNVTGGSVARAQRTDKPSNILWRITVKPVGTGDVTIELPATTDCDADGAICTGDGRKLSNSLSFTVSGPGG